MDEHTQLAMALSISMMDGIGKEQGIPTRDLPPEEPAQKPKKKGRKKKKKDEDLDEQTQIAMAMSASLADKTKQKDKDLGKNGDRPGKKPRTRAKGKLKKVHQEFPVLLTRQDDERQKIIEERISALLESSRSEDFTFSDHVFQPSKIRSKYLHPDSRLLTENYPGNIKIESGQKIWIATGADLSKKETGMSPFYVTELQPTIVPIAPKRRTSLTSHQVSSKTSTKTPSKQSPKSAATSKEVLGDESLSVTQSLGMTVQCLAELAEEGLQDSMSLSSDKCGFLPQETAQRNDSPDIPVSDDQLTLLEELSSLVNSPTMSDAVIKLDEGSKLHVHSFMIQLRCPALATILAKSLGRNSTSLPSIVVSDMSYEAMESVLGYIYAATVNITNTTAAEINRFAERFEMRELASRCKPYLQDATDSHAERKRSELDIVDKDLNQLIDSLWEDEEDNEEKHKDAGRTTDDDGNESLDDDEIQEIALTQRGNIRILNESSECDSDDPFAFEFPLGSSPKRMVEDDEEEMRDADLEDEVEVMQGRSNIGSRCSRSNTSDDNEDWSMAMDNDVVLPGEEPANCVSPLIKRTTNQINGIEGKGIENGHSPSNSLFSDSRCAEDLMDDIPNGSFGSKRKESSTSRNETITGEPHHSTFEESFHSFVNKTLVLDCNSSAASLNSSHKERETSPEIPVILNRNSKDVEGCKMLNNVHKNLLDDKVDRSDSPEDEILLLQFDSMQSETEGPKEGVQKSQLSMRKKDTQADNSTRLKGKGKDCRIDDTGQWRFSSPKKKKLLVQTDSDGSQSPPDISSFCYEDEVKLVGTVKPIDKLHLNPSIVLKKLSKTLDDNKFDKDTNVKHRRSASQASSTENQDDFSFTNRLDSLDGSLSEDILSPSPTPSPRFTRTSQMPRLEKMFEDRRSLISSTEHGQLNHCRNLNKSAPARTHGHENGDDPYELSPSSSSSSGKRRRHRSSSKRKRQRKVEQETQQSANPKDLSSSSQDSNASSKETKRRWSSLKLNHDYPSRRSRDTVQGDREPEVLQDLSPSSTFLPQRLSPSHPLTASPTCPVPKASSSMPMSPDVSYREPPYCVSPTSPALSHRISPSPPMTGSSAAYHLPRASPVPGASPAIHVSPNVSYRHSPYSEMDDMPERFAYDMEEGCGFDDFNVVVDHPNLDDDQNGGVGEGQGKDMEDRDDFNGNDAISEHVTTLDHQNERFEEENEIDLTNDEEEDKALDDVDHQSQSLRTSVLDDPVDVNSNQPAEDDTFNSYRTPQSHHSRDARRGLVGGGPIEKTRGHPILSQSLRTTPRTSQMTSGAVLKTPSVSRLIRDEYYPAAPITPMPNFDSMLTPELKKELKRYGVKPLGKKKSKLLLAEIFSYLHQVMPEDQSDEDTSSTSKTNPEPAPTKARSKKGKVAKSKPTTNKSQAPKKPKEESSSDNISTKETSRKAKDTTKKPTKPRKRKKAEWDLDDTPMKRVKTESPVEEGIQDAPVRSVGIEESAWLDEPVSSQDSNSSSLDSNKSDFGESIYCENLEEEDNDDDVMATQQVKDMATEVRRYILRKKDLHQKILNYEVLNLDEFYKELKEAKVPCSKPKLMEFLDQQCITFRHKEGSRQRKAKSTKTSTKTKR